MSAPDPAAALRAFVIEQKKVGKYRDPSRYVTMDYTRAAPALLAHVERLEAERDRLREEKRKVRAALVALVGEDDPEILREMLCAVSVMAARGIGTKDAGANSAAIEALIEVKP